jgi:hypothetical protein
MVVGLYGDGGDGQRYYDEHDHILWEVPPHTPNASVDVHVQWMLPEWFHSIENTGPLPGTTGRLGTAAGGGFSGGGYAALRVMMLDTVKNPQEF